MKWVMKIICKILGHEMTDARVFGAGVLCIRCGYSREWISLDVRDYFPLGEKQ